MHISTFRHFIHTLTLLSSLSAQIDLKALEAEPEKPKKKKKVSLSFLRV